VCEFIDIYKVSLQQIHPSKHQTTLCYENTYKNLFCRLRIIIKFATEVLSVTLSILHSCQSIYPSYIQARKRRERVDSVGHWIGY